MSDDRLTTLARDHLTATSTTIRLDVIATLAGHVNGRAAEASQFMAHLNALIYAVANCLPDTTRLHHWQAMERSASNRRAAGDSTLTRYLDRVVTALEEP